MGRADYEGIVRYSVTDNLAEEAVDTQLTRVLVNNITHFADEDGQVLVSTPPASIIGFMGSVAFSGATDPVHVATFGPFNSRLKSDRRAFPIRVRMYADLDAGASTCKAWIVYGDPALAQAYITDGGANVLYCSPTTTAAWLTSYDASGAAQTKAVVTVTDIAASRTTIQTVDAIGGNETSVDVAGSYISVWCEGLTGAATFRLMGFYAAEFYG